MAKAGKLALVKLSGDPVPFVGEATVTADDQTYRITDETKTPWGKTDIITVLDGGIATVETYTLNRLTGQIIFEVVDNTRVITVSGNYIPTATLLEAYDFSYSIEASNEDITHFEQHWINRKQTLKDFTASVSNYDVTNKDLFDQLVGEKTMVIEFFHDNTLPATGWDMRAWVMIANREESGAVDGIEEGTLELEGTADDDLRSISNNP